MVAGWWTGWVEDILVFGYLVEKLVDFGCRDDEEGWVHASGWSWVRWSMVAEDWLMDYRGSKGIPDLCT